MPLIMDELDKLATMMNDNQKDGSDLADRFSPECETPCRCSVNA